MSDDITLTKAKLFTVGSDDGSWNEIGVGYVSIEMDTTSSQSAVTTPEDDSMDGATSEEAGSPSKKADKDTYARIVVISIEEDKEVLMSTPVVVDDVYLVQHGAIVVWSDPEIGRDMALSFNSQQGCRYILDKIVEFQRSRRPPQIPAQTASIPRQMQKEASATSSSSADQQSPWTVCRENLPAILLAVMDNQKRFGLYVRDNDKFFVRLAQLYHECCDSQDQSGCDTIGRIVVSMLAPPFNTEGKILCQFIENDVIDSTIDIVQYALGRRTKAQGYVDFATRRSSFSNPLRLPSFVAKKIHALYSVQFLKDLLPLFLDEGDAMGSSLLGIFLLRFKFGLISELVRNETLLSGSFQEEEYHTSLQSIHGLVAFLLDVSKSVKNAMIPLEPKEELFEAMMERGTLEYFRRLLSALYTVYLPNGQKRPEFVANTEEEALRNNDAASLEVKENKRLLCAIVSMVCDVIGHMVMFLPRARDELIMDATKSAAQQQVTPRGLFRKVGQGDYLDHNQILQTYDARKTRSVNTANNEEEPARASVPSLWEVISCKPSSTCSYKLLDALMLMGVFAAETGDSTTAQAVYDAVYSCGIGLMQGAALQAIGMNIHPKRKLLLRYWVEGPPGTALLKTTATHSTSPTNVGSAHQPPTSTSSEQLLDDIALPNSEELKVTDGSDTVTRTPPNAFTQSSRSSSDALLSMPSSQKPIDTSKWPSLYRIIDGASEMAATLSETWCAQAKTTPQHLSSRFHGLVYLLKLINALVKDVVIALHPNLVVMLSTSNLLGSLTQLLGQIRSDRRLHDVRAAIFALLAALISHAHGPLTHVVLDSGALSPVCKEYLESFGKRNCVSASAAANVLFTVHHSVHLKKSGALGNGRISAQRPSGRLNGSPFVRFLGRDDGLGSDSSDGPSSNATEGLGLNGMPSSVETSLVMYLLDSFGAELQHSSIAAHRALFDSLKKTVEESPEDAQMEERQKSSTSCSRVVIDDHSFTALLAEYGPDVPISEKRLEEVIAETLSKSPPMHTAKGIDDEEDLSNSSKEEEEGGYLLLRRQSTVGRRQREVEDPEENDDARSNGTSSLPSSIEDDGDTQDATLDEPSLKKLRGEGDQDEHQDDDQQREPELLSSDVLSDGDRGTDALNEN